MSSGDSPSVENEALSGRVEAIEKKVDQLSSTLSQARWIRLIIFLLLVGLVGAVSMVTYKEIMRFKSKENMDLLVKKAQERLNENSATYSREVQALVDNVSPVVTEALYEQSSKDMPKYVSAIENERGALLENMKSRLTDQVNDHYREAVDRHKDLLQKKFPEITDAETIDRLSLTMQEGLERLLKKYFADELAGELESMYATWDKFPAAKQMAKGEKLEENFIGNLMQLLTIKFSGLEESKTKKSPVRN